MNRSIRLVLLALLVALSAAIGCSRTRYRTAADRDAYCIVQEKAQYLTEELPDNFTVRPDQRSRFFDPTNPDCPQLPVPRPVLRGYDLPPLASESNGSHQHQPLDETPASSPAPVAPNSTPNTTPGATPGPTSNTPPNAVPNMPQESNDSGVEPTSAQMPADGYSSRTSSVITAAFEPPQETEPLEPPKEAAPPSALVSTVPIPAKAWEVLPQSCIDRMLEFQTLRDEYALSFKAAQPTTTPNNKRALSLANVMEIANINSREYQLRKEALFRTALTLTRQRYQFELNPIPFGNGTAANYRHLRTGGIEQNTLSIPTGVGVQRTLATGGQFLATFANSVVLTFNGPSGFATDIGSEVVFDFQQTLLQRDIRFEQLTQNERDVLYAARDYMRFRKQLFRDIAGLYYNLLVSYRGIEINAQDYFTNLRGFLQSQAEYRTAEKIPRVQVDQFEQNVLRTRGNLVNNCFNLESSLDQFKFRLGLPTEMTIHIDLSELESISLKDELSVARQMINRARTELVTARSTTTMDVTTLANVAEVLADRMDKILRIQARMDATTKAGQAADPTSNDPNRPSGDSIAKARRELSELRYFLKILGVRMQVDMLRSELDEQVKSATPAPALRVLIRAVDLIGSELQVIDLALEAAADEQADIEKDEVEKADKEKRQSDKPPGDKAKIDRATVIEQSVALAKRLKTLIAYLDELSANVGANVSTESLAILEKIPERKREAVELAAEVRRLSSQVTQDILPTDVPAINDKVQDTVDKTIALSDRLLEKGPDGWAEIVIDHDEALLTSLVQRLDLMNQRGQLADGWRQIKLAGDDLRSIINLQATQVLRTDSKHNNPFDFTFDDSETRIGAALDTPLNRRLQRNNFRLALINYNVGLRNLMAAEDSIKLDVREDLRQLSLDRNQYVINVASAALAYERVISTRMRLQLGVQNVAARDFLEAQQAYTTALSNIARQHVNYITDRIELFFDLEAFDVDRCGHWQGVTEDYGPQINVDFPSTNPRPYDSLPPKVRYSPTIRGMEQIPPGNAIVR